MESYLPVIWAAIIGLAVAMYVILDGFDLGIGILFPFAASERGRDQMMNSVAPFWDGNETWLILGGNGLLVAFPLAYAIIMPALYVPLILMLLALVFRGVAFEFRWVAKPHHRKWDIAFTAGSAIAAFSQGLMLGGLLHGIHVADRKFAGGPFDWLTPFSLLVSASLVGGYALLGAGWIVFKTEGELFERARRWLKRLAKDDPRTLLHVAQGIAFMKRVTAAYAPEAGQVNAAGADIAQTSHPSPTNIDDRRLAEFSEKEIADLLRRDGFGALVS
jgi:cytochrome d ubiquinol oxidase subunit II